MLEQRRQQAIETGKGTRGGAASLDLVLLGFLAIEPLHGYEISRRVNRCFGSIARLSWGSLYPALSRLQRRSFVASKPLSTRGFDASQLSGSLAAEFALVSAVADRMASARNRKVYQITEAGRERLAELVAQTEVDDSRSFWFAISFSDQAEPAVRVELLRQRKQVLGAQLHDLRQADSGGAAFNLAMAGLTTRLQAEIEWCDKAIAESLDSKGRG